MAGGGGAGEGDGRCFQSSAEAGAQMYTRPSAQSPAIQDTQQPGGRNGGSKMTAQSPWLEAGKGVEQKTRWVSVGECLEKTLHARVLTPLCSIF